MLIHQPTDNERIVWNGGDSTQLHYEMFLQGEWKAIDTRTIYDFPKSVKKFKKEVQDYYDFIAPEVAKNYVEYIPQ